MRVRRLQGLTGSLPPATYADSTNVANFARAAQDFYNDPNNNYVVGDSWSPAIYARMNNVYNWNGLLDQLVEGVREQNKMAGTGDLGIVHAINTIKSTFGNDLTASDFMRMANDPNQIMPTDMLYGKSDAMFNPNAPDPVFDRRILPERMTRYLLDPFSADVSDIPEYDVIMVTPWQDLTDDEKKERVDKAIRTGNTGGIPQQVLQTANIQGQTMTKTKTKKNPYTGSSTGLLINTPFEMPSLPPSQIPTEALEERGLAPVMRVKSRGREPQTIYKQDPRVSTGQYPVGERIWDEDKKQWVERMWDKEMQRDARELAKPRKERWRTIETPPGGFESGGKVRVKKKDSNIDPKKDKLRNELMNAYLSFINNASYKGNSVKMVQGWPKEDRILARFDNRANNHNRADYQNAFDLLKDYQDAHTNATHSLQYYPSVDAYQSNVIYHTLPQDAEIAFLDLYDPSQRTDQYISIPRPNFRIDEMNPFEVVGIDQKMFDKQLQTPNTQQKVQSIKTEPIMKADSSVRGGQYQVGERVWDPKKKRWQDKMWDSEDRKASKELRGELKERWRTIETPPGGFMNGGKIKVKKKC